MDKQCHDNVATLPLIVAVDLPVFEGHFPGAPLVPGALQLEWMLRSLPCGNDANARWTLNNAKFLKPLLPGTCACIRVVTFCDTYRCAIESKDGMHASATFKRVS